MKSFSPTRCPWGQIDQRERIAPGIVSVSTPSHGGLCLSPELWEQFREIFPTSTSYGGEGFLEEDCDWALAPLAFPEMFGDRDCFYAVETVDGSEYHQEGNAFLKTEAAQRVIRKHDRYTMTVDGREALKRYGKPVPQLLAGENQGDLITSTQSEPYALVQDHTLDGAAFTAAADARESANAQTLAQNLELF